MINVLMCTYNGGKYIRQQLDSIMAQTYQDFCLYIRDDGSTDLTISIVDEYVGKYPGKIRKVVDAKHLGYPDCFWEVLKVCDTSDYYAFSDQDDIWDEHKLEYAVKSLENTANDNTSELMPLLYIHDSDICDSQENVIGTHKLTDAGEISYSRIMFYTIAQGFSMVINDAMRREIMKNDVFSKDLSHDQWIIWKAFFCGRIIGDNRILAKYRRHEDTVTKTAGGLGVMINNWIHNEIFGDEFHRQCNRLKIFLDFNIDSFDKKQADDWRILLYSTPSVRNYFKRLFYGSRLRPSLGGELALRINFLLGMK